jgi:hypothetical protein
MTTDKLYEQVWSEPIHKLCRQYGMSDRGLARSMLMD